MDFKNRKDLVFIILARLFKFIKYYYFWPAYSNLFKKNQKMEKMKRARKKQK